MGMYVCGWRVGELERDARTHVLTQWCMVCLCVVVITIVCRCMWDERLKPAPCGEVDEAALAASSGFGGLSGQPTVEPQEGGKEEAPEEAGGGEGGGGGSKKRKYPR